MKKNFIGEYNTEEELNTVNVDAFRRDALRLMYFFDDDHYSFYYKSDEKIEVLMSNAIKFKSVVKEILDVSHYYQFSESKDTQYLEEKSQIEKNFKTIVSIVPPSENWYIKKSFEKWLEKFEPSL